MLRRPFGITALALLAALVFADLAHAASLRFYGHGVDMIDRVKIRIDDPALPADPGPPVDVGATDFTIEFFLRGSAAENSAGPIACSGYDWIYGNIVLDRDRFNQGRAFGISLTDSVVAFGVQNDVASSATICGSTDVLDDDWHHIAVQRRRSDGRLWLYVDGSLELEFDGPDGDLSYPDDGVPGNFCGGPCTDSDPFVVLGAEKHDAWVASFPSFSGWLDELRFSNTLRYSGPTLVVPTQAFDIDPNTVALYHFDEASSGDCTGMVLDVSGATGGPSQGECRFGGTAPAGPVYSVASPFATSVPALSAVWYALAVVVLGGVAVRARKT
jgi:hypothetical protein